MISVKTAKKLVLKHASIFTEAKTVSLQNALNNILAQDVVSEIDMPPFRQSAMDGYAVNIGKTNDYLVVDEIKAGDGKNPQLKNGEAVRIFTGAAVPDAANAVIMQEKTNRNENRLIIEDLLKVGMNIRRKGEQIKVGDIALKKGTKINAAHIGVLASLGITKVAINEKPSIAILVTGNELIQPGNALTYGAIYESNGAMLVATLNNLGYKDISLIRVPDDFEQTKKTLDKAIKNHQVVIATGGVSVGDYDFVGKAFNDLEVEEIFYKVKQKPGKPLFFGKKGTVFIFGLPGNPAAALTCFYIYVYPLLRKNERAAKTELTRIAMPLQADFSKKGNRAQFLKAKLQGAEVAILGGQSSAMLQAFGEADALVYLPEDATELKKGDSVETILLPVN